MDAPRRREAINNEVERLQFAADDFNGLALELVGKSVAVDACREK
jgi:hypothetical protein